LARTAETSAAFALVGPPHLGRNRHSANLLRPHRPMYRTVRGTHGPAVDRAGGGRVTSTACRTQGQHPGGSGARGPGAIADSPEGNSYIPRGFVPGASAPGLARPAYRFRPGDGSFAVSPASRTREKNGSRGLGGWNRIGTLIRFQPPRPLPGEHSGSILCAQCSRSAVGCHWAPRTGSNVSHGVTKGSWRSDTLKSW
jgi:hypothetical protein